MTPEKNIDAMPPFSVLMAVYHADSPIFLDQALQSIAKQSLEPNELVLVIDGPISPDLYAIIHHWQPLLPIKTVPLPVQGGLGKALQQGVLACEHEIICRADADDINLAERFRIQVDFLSNYPEIAAVGTWTIEIDENGEALGTMRQMPNEHEQIVRIAKRRSPLNHPTVAFRKSAVLAAGNYQDFRFGQDYDLWARMILASLRLANINQALVQMRSGKGLMRRRGGIKYLGNEFQLLKYLRKIGFYSSYDLALNLVIRSGFRLIPSGLRKLIYQRFLRKTGDENKRLVPERFD